VERLLVSGNRNTEDTLSLGTNKEGLNISHRLIKNNVKATFVLK